MSAELASEETVYAVVEGEPPEVLSRNLTVAGYLLAGATAFFFLAFLFAFFYLRSIDHSYLWKPPRVNASVGWGTAIVACWVVSAVLVRLGLADYTAERRSQWRLKGLLALVAGVSGLVLQGLSWSYSSFGPTNGAYASVYVGWTAFMFLFVLITLYWLETTLATSYRYRDRIDAGKDAPPGHASGDPGRMGHDISNSISLVGVELTAMSFYWSFLAGVAVVTWAILYLVG